MTSPQLVLCLEKRISKKQQIANFFFNHMGVKYRSEYLHQFFGSAVRTRISEINRDQKQEITIRNEVQSLGDGAEHSVYWAVKREVQ